MSRDLREQRRRFLKLAGGSAAVLPLAGLTGCGGGDEPAPPAPEPAASAPESPASAPAPEPMPAAEAPAEPAAPAAAGELTPLTEDDPQARALAYVNDASTVDGAAYPQYQAGQACANCVLFQGSEGDAMAACSIFPGRLVDARGWCSVYAPKA